MVTIICVSRKKDQEYWLEHVYHSKTDFQLQIDGSDWRGIFSLDPLQNPSLKHL